MAALFAGRLAGAGGMLEVSRAARCPARDRRPPGRLDLILDGLTMLVTERPGRGGADAAGRAERVFADAGMTAGEGGLRWGWLAQGAASVLWDDGRLARSLVLRQVRLGRAAGALDQLPVDAGARSAHRRRVAR